MALHRAHMTTRTTMSGVYLCLETRDTAMFTRCAWEGLRFDKQRTYVTKSGCLADPVMGV